MDLCVYSCLLDLELHMQCCDFVVISNVCHIDRIMIWTVHFVFFEISYRPVKLCGSRSESSIAMWIFMIIPLRYSIVSLLCSSVKSIFSNSNYILLYKQACGNNFWMILSKKNLYNPLRDIFFFDEIKIHFLCLKRFHILLQIVMMMNIINLYFQKL